MKTITLYCENTEMLENALEKITDTFPCFIDRDFIEMNYSCLKITCRNEDAVSILALIK